MKSFLFVLAFFLPVVSFSQAGVSGYVFDAATRKAIPAASVVVAGVGVATDGNGFFLIDGLAPGECSMAVSVVGYSKFERTITAIQGDTISVDVPLTLSEVQIDGVVVTATRVDTRIGDTPGRICLVTPERLSLTVAQTTDEYLSLIPGVRVNRPFGLFSHKSVVSMRGLSGNEQARALVLIDGIPVNKADGGSVNWNLISTFDIDRIEVVKGPTSALYGGNAMGGIVNVITSVPTRGVQGSASILYGTYNTQGARARFAGRLGNVDSKSYYWAVNGHYRKSDGYFTQSDADLQMLGDNAVKSCFHEKALNFRAGFSNATKIQTELDFTVYDDMRGTGQKYVQPDGNSVDHDAYQLRTSAKGAVGNFGWNASLFYLSEHYKAVNESVKGGYSWYNVSSYRKDLGFLSSFSYSLPNQRIVSGLDVRSGAVDGSDIYYTSTDRIDNKGRMDFYALYLQDEVMLFRNRVTLVIGLRYDIARFSDGEFTIHNPSDETLFMDQFQFSGLNDEVWGALSPRLSVQYKPNSAFRLYSSYSRGFRPSVLDDLCRSGRVRGGFKVANPELKPEYLHNVEMGADYRPADWIKLSSSLYYSRGTDFMYYVSTGDSIDMGYADRPIMIRSNISNVQIYGFEFDFAVSVLRAVTLFGNYAFTSPTILDYKPLQLVDPVNLSGNYLTDVPRHLLSAGALLRHRWVNVGLTCRCVGPMYVNDRNVTDKIVGSDVYPTAFTVDVNLSRDFARHYRAAFNVQNIFDKQIYDGSGAVGPGRFITASMSVIF